MAILKECQECGVTFYGERNVCNNCRESVEDQGSECACMEEDCPFDKEIKDDNSR